MKCSILVAGGFSCWFYALYGSLCNCKQNIFMSQLGGALAINDPNRQRIMGATHAMLFEWSNLAGIGIERDRDFGAFCSAFLGAGAYHMTMTGKWISFGLPKYLCIARIDFDFAAVASGGFRLVFGFGTRPEIWRALFMGSMNQKKSVKQVYDTFCVWLSASRWHFNLAAIDGNLINLLPDFNWVRPKEKCWATYGMIWFHLGRS